MARRFGWAFRVLFGVFGASLIACFTVVGAVHREFRRGLYLVRGAGCGRKWSVGGLVGHWFMGRTSEQPRIAAWFGICAGSVGDLTLQWSAGY